MTKTERNKKIRDAYAQGYRRDHIAQQHGLTIRQVDNILRSDDSKAKEREALVKRVKESELADADLARWLGVKVNVVRYIRKRYGS